MYVCMYVCGNVFWVYLCVCVCVCQSQFDCCVSEVHMPPMELSWVVGMFSGFVPGTRLASSLLVCEHFISFQYTVITS